MSIEHPRILNRPHLVRAVSGPIGANTNVVWTPPARQHIEILSFRIRLDTDGNVANRRMTAEIGPTLNPDTRVMATATQAANTIYDYYFERGLGFADAAIYDNVCVTGWPMGVLFAASEQLRTDVEGMQVGDQILLYTIRYQMWQDPVVVV
jgi:hypothetical protein